MTHNYNIWLWPGAGYCLDGPWEIKDASCEEHAIELLVTDLIAKESWGYLLKEDEYEKTCRELGYNPDEHDGDDLEGWLYVDATMEGAPYPVYLRIENMRIDEIK